MSILKFENVSKSYGDTPVLKDINLEVDEGEFLVILGFSGLDAAFYLLNGAAVVLVIALSKPETETAAA